MDTDNKYYKKIVEMVKNNRKFPGYEAILDDIVNDVYSHAEVILNTVDNEAVINSYLEKIISTSIITVPKKMGFQSSYKRIGIESDTPKSVLKESIKVNNDFVDKMINSKDTSEIIPEVKEEENFVPMTEESLAEIFSDASAEKVNYSDISEIDDLDNILVEDSEVASDDAQSEEDSTILYETTEYVEDSADDIYVEDNKDESEKDEDAPLVIDLDQYSAESEREEASEQNNSDGYDVLQEYETSTNDVSEDLDAVEVQELSQTEEIDEISSIETFEGVDENEDVFPELSDADTLDLSEPQEDDDFNQVETEVINNELSLELSEPEDDFSESMPTDDFYASSNLDDNQEDLLLSGSGDAAGMDLSNEEENFELIQEVGDTILSADDEYEGEDNLSVDSELDILDTDESMSDIVSLQDETIDGGLEEIEDFNIELPLEDDSETLMENQSYDSLEKQDFYSVFDDENFRNYDDEIDTNEIFSKIEELNSLHPELNIKKIYDLKYKSNMSLAQVASELNITKDQVIEALDEIIDAV